MADSGSSLAAALAYHDENEKAMRMSDMVAFVAAARRSLRLSKIPCDESTATTTKHCSKCGGSGEVWADELVEVVKQAPFMTSREARAVLDALDLYAKEAT